MNNIQSLAKRYPRIIRWDETDNVFIGSLPDLDGDCTHGSTVEEVARNLDECAEIFVEDCLNDNTPLPEPRTIIITPTTFRNRDNNHNIAKLREERGISQQSFAKLLGVSLSTLTKWENGTRNPSGAAAKLLEIIKKHPDLI